MTLDRVARQAAAQLPARSEADYFQSQDDWFSHDRLALPEKLAKAIDGELLPPMLAVG